MNSVFHVLSNALKFKILRFILIEMSLKPSSSESSSVTSQIDRNQKSNAPSIAYERSSMRPAGVPPGVYAAPEHYLLEDSTSIQIVPNRVGLGVRNSSEYHLEFVNEFLQNKAKQRAIIINKARRNFGIYCDCFGMRKSTIYFSEKEKGTLSLRFSPNGSHVVAGFGSGTIQLYNTKTLSLKNTIVHGKENGYGVTCIRFLPNDSAVFYASSAEGMVMRYNIVKDDLEVSIRQTRSEINSFDINSTASCLVTGSSYPDVKMYDLSTNHLISSYRNNNKNQHNFFQLNLTEYHRNRVQSIKFVPNDPNMFLSGGWDNTLKFWDMRTKFGCIRTICGPHISGEAIDVKNNLILTGAWSAKNTLKLWDFRSLKLIQDIIPINAPKLVEGVFTFAASFFAGDHTEDVILHSSLGYKSVDVISISQNVILHSFVSEKSCVSADSHSCNIVYGGTDNVFNFVVFFMNLLVDYRERPVATLPDDQLDIEGGNEDFSHSMNLSDIESLV